MSDDVTAGTLLRRAREAAGLHVAALAVALKVPPRKLEALEQDRYDLLTDAVFVRALASSMCRHLKVDPQPVLERLPQTAMPRLARYADSINAPYRAPNDGAPPTWFSHLARPVFLAVFGLLLAALVVILLPERQEEGVAAAALPEAAPGLVAVSSSPAEPAVSSPAPGPAVTAVIAPAPVASAPAPAASSVIVFKAKAPSWVEVTDAKGIVAVRKLLAAGEAAGASGALPLKVTIGRVDTTDVQVRGQPFDLRPVSRDNVARFEVK
ncbi:MAG: helix-turn-helix domain-containing protein [Ramlibacter sp.]|nr:helix-turn-helix domain-containing protein [Ramlibacter sp.]